MSTDDHNTDDHRSDDPVGGDAPRGIWMCELCFDAVEIGVVLPGVSLIRRSDGVFALLGGQGHAHDELVIFDTPPTPDPAPSELLAAAG